MEFLKIQDEIDYSQKRYKLTREIESMFIKAGYIEIQPSVFEDYDDFTCVNKRIKKESMVKVLNSNSKILILRPDITMNIIKGLIPRWEKNLKLKLFYNSIIFRNKVDSNIKEFRQMGIEYLGENSIESDKDIISLALKVLKTYSSDFILEVGNSRYLDGLLKEINLKETSVQELKNLIYKKNKLELTNYVASLNLNKEIYDVLTNILELQGNIEEVIDKAQKYYMNYEMKQSIKELEELKNLMKEYEFLKHIHFDLSMLTELDYYDGVILKGYYPNTYKEIVSGGRYDSLTESFGNKVCAIGFCIDLDELMRVSYRGGEREWSI